MNAQFAQSYLGIGEVLGALRADFPDISVSKIRFLESEGLVSPARSPSGYRRFSPADIARLRYILAAQRDQYLPLRVIRERLEHGEAATDRAGTMARSASTGHAEMVSRRDLLDAGGVSDEQLDDLEAHGLVRRIGRLYGQDALDVVAAVAALAPFGVEARHLRTVRTAAERDVALIEQLVAPVLRQRSPQAREAAGKSARQIAALLLRLHRAVIESALTEAGMAGDMLPEPGQASSTAPSSAPSAASRRSARTGVRGASA
jgi:DNA-binding transcriptional MerR regulator